MRSAVWTVRSVDEVFFASDTIIGRKKQTKTTQYILFIDVFVIKSYLQRRISWEKSKIV